MADSNSTSPRCPCGFWGTPQTGGLCSKCYREKEQSKSVPGTNSGPVGGATALPVSDINASLEQDRPSSNIQVGSPASSMKSSPSEMNTCLTNAEDDQGSEDATKTGASSAQTPDSSSSESNSSNKRDISEVQDATESELPIQKNKKRCFKCNVRLELAIRELGRCKCNYVFCQQHRLPEQHSCVFDYKERGRKEAREKMISPKKHAGTSIKRMDSQT